MSTFYGTVKGCRGVATRCGSRESGIKASAQSWDGSVVVRLDYNDANELMVYVGTDSGSSSSCWPKWHGTFDEFENLLEGREEA